MTWFEIGALVVIALAVLDGLVSGFVWAVLELCVLVGAALAARALRTTAEPYMLKVAALSPEHLPWATHVVLFVLTALLLFGVLLLVHPATKRWRFRGDRVFGAVLGMFTGVLACLVLVSVALWATPAAHQDTLRESPLTRSLGAAFELGLAPLFPEPAPERLERLSAPR
jgi:uncharacterized membrane protein required for colicin V production